ncbi:Xylem bark cysteine peptidase 3 isoform 1 [Hibiscus syriacus]|uniref:Xylem bark cysteine peptidase 3 isoform 1 n=1 Tax=Hibiscus syriacus TaxID=106335 RepID=A0A6A3BJL2_HIBSY|nr:Xylem bark cysteine peptidase 3 isoform 1 [Hibiscus syriacus]
MENYPHIERYTAPSNSSDVSLDLETRPVAVPFIWEQIPGKAKSGIDGDLQPNKEAFGTFSTDPQTLDFMMTRFLPAAKAMTLVTPQYASRKQSMAPECSKEVKKEVAKPSKAYMKSNGQIVEQNICDFVYKNKSCCGVQSPGFSENKSDSAAQSLRLLEDKSDNGVQSPRLSEIRKNMACGSNHFASSNDQQIINRSPPERLAGGARISPYRRERPRSPFGREGFLGMPKKADRFKANVFYGKSNDNSQELITYPRTRQGSMSPAVEKTLYVDVVIFFFENACSNSNSSDTNAQMDSIGKHSDTSVMSKMLEETAIAECSLQYIKGLCLSDEKGVPEYEITGSMNSSCCSFSSKPEYGGLDTLYESFEPIKVRALGSATLSDDYDSRVVDQGEAKAGSGCSPLPPLPKTPSQSWLKCALPSVIPRNSFLQSYSTHYNHEKHEPKIPATDAKWETTVKTSQLHHDHARYSEFGFNMVRAG